MTVRDDISERAQARVGAVLKGKWRLDAVLGIGGMATVYGATHRNRSRVAIKMLHPDVAVSQDVTNRFLREGYVGNAVAHPGTVKVLDDDVTEDGVPFLVMELLEGESLGMRLEREGRLPARDVALLADQLLDVLAAAHAAHIVHRDLKPDNVFLTLEGRVKVLDFGIARLREAAHESSASTQAGSLLGTPAFMAPEQALGRWKEVDERTDIWAIGATLFNLLTGRFVHEADSVQEQLVLAATHRAASVAQLAPQTPPWLVAVVDRALSFGRDARFADARSMQAALRSTAQGLEFPPHPLSAGGGAAQVAVAFTPTGGSLPFSSPRASSPSFSEGATLAAPSGSQPSVPSAGTFASVQAVARSAQEPARAPSSKRALLVAGGLGLAALAAGGLVWGVLQGTAPAATAAGSNGLPAAEVVRPSLAASLLTDPAKSRAERPSEPSSPAPPSTTATAPIPRASAQPAVATSAPNVTSKRPLARQPKPVGKKPPEQQENLFDNRH
jgi:serine/threonine-protein kinase